MIISFSENGWEEYLYWLDTDKKLTKKINELIKECTRTPFEGRGKPEPLKENYSGFWSRRITDEHRLVYSVKGNQSYIVQCRFHY